MKICSVKNCGRRFDAKGYCGTHYRQWKTHGKITERIEPRMFGIKFCTAKDCRNKNYAKGLCSKHFARKYVYKITGRSVRDRNEIITDGDKSFVVIYDKSNAPIAKAVIDSCDVSLVAEHKWHFSGGYARNQKLGMHNLILGRKIVDHINGDRLDNRRKNLRAATLAENAANTSGYSKKTSSKYKGVFKCGMTKKPWRVYVAGVFVGRYHSEEEAAWMYDQYAINIFGDFAKTNFSYHPHTSCRSNK